MLRRKFLVVLGLIVTLLLCTAILAILLLQDVIGDLDRIPHGEADTASTGQLHDAIGKLRMVAIGLGLVFVVVLNASIIVLGRMTSMILKPVDKLVDASRCLAREDFSHRVQLDRRDEFGELARAYNSLAEQLQCNEERKIETLHQVARTLNHELNNAIAIIQLQLIMFERGGKNGNQLQAERLREIHAALARMSRIVIDLTRVRRIILTDYISGVKMLDLERSVEVEPDSTRSSAQPASSTSVT